MAIAEADSNRLLQEHAAGDSLRTLGKRYGISHESARKYIAEAVDGLAFDAVVALYTAWRDEQLGKTGEWPAMVVPYQAQPDRQIALNIFSAVTARLRDRKVPVKVLTQHVAPGFLGSVGGSRFMWTLDNDELQRREAAKETTHP